jgi:hypothetical protein
VGPVAGAVALPVQKPMAAQAGRMSGLGPLRIAIGCPRGGRAAGCQARPGPGVAPSRGVAGRRAVFKNFVPARFLRRLPRIVPQQAAQPLLADHRRHRATPLRRQFARQRLVPEGLVGPVSVMIGHVLRDQVCRTKF